MKRILLLIALLLCVGLAPTAAETLDYDVVVVGAGSGGCGAAIAAARGGLEVLLIEKRDEIGGTAAQAGVNQWEFGAGGTGLPFEIYRRLQEIPGAVGITSFDRHILWPDPGRPRFPGGFRKVDPERCYADTLQRHGARSMRADEEFCREHWHSVVFEPQHYVQVLREMLEETGNCDIRTGTTFTGVEAKDGFVSAVTLSSGELVRAPCWIDSTGDGVLCIAAGCKALRGIDPRSRFQEPGAPKTGSEAVNGVSLIYRVTPVEEPAVEKLPEGIPQKCWWRGRFPVVSCFEYPNGDRNMNMLPTMSGGEFVKRGRKDAYDECRRRVHAHWHHLQKSYPEFRGFRLKWIAPMLGIRESNRIVCAYMLKEQDLTAGLDGQAHDDIIAIADHSMDRHAPGGASGELDQPYGVPYRCLIPEGLHNLLVACRGAGFSSIAASSCRLSRTMMQLGQAAGTAAVLANRLEVDLPKVPADKLRKALREHHVQLKHPMRQELRRYLEQPGF